MIIGLDCKKTCAYSFPCFPMDVPQNDDRVKHRKCIDFVRSSSICGTDMTSVFFDKLQPREQINQLTAFIDGSQVTVAHLIVNKQTKYCIYLLIRRILYLRYMDLRMTVRLYCEKYKQDLVRCEVAYRRVSVKKCYRSPEPTKWIVEEIS